MANTQAPYGFKFLGLIGGAAPNYAPSQYKIASSYTTAIFQGDPVYMQTTGYLARGISGTIAVQGIFNGCSYLSTAAKRTVWSNYWPGSDAAGDVTAWVDDNPQSQFQVQSTGSAAIGQADIMSNVGVSIGTGSTASGVSGAAVDQSTLNTTSTLPFRVVGLVTAPPGVNGTDISTAYNDVVVMFANSNFRNTLGIA